MDSASFILPVGYIRHEQPLPTINQNWGKGKLKPRKLLPPPAPNPHPSTLPGHPLTTPNFTTGVRPPFFSNYFNYFYFSSFFPLIWKWSLMQGCKLQFLSTTCISLCLLSVIKGSRWKTLQREQTSLLPAASQEGAQVLSLILHAAVNWICLGDLGRKDAIARHLHTGNLSWYVFGVTDERGRQMLN